MTSLHHHHILGVISKSQVQPTLKRRGLYKGMGVWGHFRVFLPQSAIPKGTHIGRPEKLRPWNMNYHNIKIPGEERIVLGSLMKMTSDYRTWIPEQSPSPSQDSVRYLQHAIWKPDLTQQVDKPQSLAWEAGMKILPEPRIPIRICYS